MNKKLPKKGDKVKFIIRNPNWELPLEVKGVVESSTNKFGGFITLKKGCIIQEQMIIRLDSIIE